MYLYFQALVLVAACAAVSAGYIGHAGYSGLGYGGYAGQGDYGGHGYEGQGGYGGQAYVANVGHDDGHHGDYYVSWT